MKMKTKEQILDQIENIFNIKINEEINIKLSEHGISWVDKYGAFSNECVDSIKDYFFDCRREQGLDYSFKDLPEDWVEFGLLYNNRNFFELDLFVKNAFEFLASRER